MFGTTKLLAVIACCAIFLAGVTAQAGVLNGHPSAYNDGNGPLAGAWTGTSPFVNDGLNGTIDWAVFTSSTFNALFGGGGYAAPAGELVYAHQVFSAGPLVGVSGMDIFLGGNPAGNGGSFSAGGVTGVPAVFAFADPSIATYVLATETDPLTPSEGLVYSSPNVPQLTGVPIVVDGGLSASGELPIGIPSSTPIPEPASCCLFGLMASGLLLGFRRARSR
jgi:hypothetical protein